MGDNHIDEAKPASGRLAVMLVACSPVASILLMASHDFGMWFLLAIAPVFLMSAGVVAVRRSWHRLPRETRVAIAASLAFAATWWGVEWSTVSYSMLSKEDKEAWIATHGLDVSMRPREAIGSLSGFPVRAIEGTDGFFFWEQGRPIGGSHFGYPPPLPLEKGLWVLLLNLVILAAAAALIVWFIPSRWLSWSFVVSCMCAASAFIPMRWWTMCHGW